MEFTEETELEGLLRFSISKQYKESKSNTQLAPKLNCSESIQNIISETLVPSSDLNSTFNDFTNHEVLAGRFEKNDITKLEHCFHPKNLESTKEPENQVASLYKAPSRNALPRKMFRLTVFYFFTNRFLEFDIERGTLIKYVMNKAIIGIDAVFSNRERTPRSISNYTLYYPEEASHLPDQDFEISPDLKIEQTRGIEFCLIEKESDETNPDEDVKFSMNPDESDYIFKIQFNSEEINIKADPNQSLKALFLYLSNKKSIDNYMNLDNYEFMIKIKTEGNKEEVCPVAMDLKVKNLNTTRLILHRKQYLDIEQEKLDLDIKPDHPEADVVYNSYKMTRSEACKYKEYIVTKINRRGKRQIRVLGIDQLKIHNMTQSQTLDFQLRKRLFYDDTFLGRLKRMIKGLPKRTGVKIDQILSVSQELQDLKNFVIVFQKEGNVINTYYVADSPQIAEEIVAKISYIKRLNHF